MDARDPESVTPAPDPPEGSLPLVQIERLVFQGDGLGRLADGRVIFVPLTAPGDGVEVRLAAGRPDFARGEAAVLRTPSPLRVAPPCPVFGSCGGCQWQHLQEDAQREWKREILRELLVRVGKLPDLPVDRVLGPLDPFGYRARVQFKVAGGRPPRIGFHRRESHQVVEVGHCPLLRPELNGILRVLRGMRTPDLGQLFPGLSELWATVGAGTGEAVLCLFGQVRDRAALRLLFHLVREAVPGLQGVVALAGDPRRRPRVVDRHGRGAIHEQVGEHRFRVDATSFFQVSGRAAEALTTLVLEAAALTGTERVLELYCGVGTFTVPLARRAGLVVGIESHPAALAAARHNLRENGCATARLVQGQAEQLLSGLAGEGPWDLVVLDPPRQGADRRLLEALAGLAVRRMIYVSCDPSTLARDLGILAGRGYRCLRLRPVDLFPQTYHLETVAVLERTVG